MDISAALPTFVITLREGVEAALVVGIVMAYLKKVNQTRLYAWVYSGIGAGIGASVVVGVLLSGVLVALQTSENGYAQVLKPALEGVFGVVAIALLSWMLIWMTQQAKSMKGEIEDSITSALRDTGAGWGVFGLIAVAVLREGFETVVFIIAKFEQGGMATAGAIAGLMGAVGIGILLFRLGIRINLRRFFQVMGVLLLLIVCGLVVGALRHFDGAVSMLAQLDPQYSSLCISSASCILGPQVWDTSAILPDKKFPGILLKAFFGYTERLYLLQAVGYVAFLLTIGSIYVQSVTGRNLFQLGQRQPSQESQ
ncbi:MAG: FTR1 family iron permease [Elainellaceae cyanobacterium]